MTEACSASCMGSEGPPRDGWRLCRPKSHPVTAPGRPVGPGMALGPGQMGGQCCVRKALRSQWALLSPGSPPPLVLLGTDQAVTSAERPPPP